MQDGMKEIQKKQWFRHLDGEYYVETKNGKQRIYSKETKCYYPISAFIEMFPELGE